MPLLPMTVSLHAPSEYSCVCSDLGLKKRELFQLILFILLLIQNVILIISQIRRPSGSLA